MKVINQIEPWVNREEEKEILQVLRSGWLTEAEKTEQFAKMVAEFVASRYASVLANGTVTLFAGLKALGVGPGDEVIVPDMTMVASPNSIALTGAKPIFVDISRENLCLDLNEVEKKITSRTKAMMPVAFNGRAPNMERLLKIVQKHQLFMIEDAAQALGCYYQGQHLGTFGDVGSFSFSTPKIITTGQGGALVTNSKKIYEKIIRVKDFGRIDRKTQDHDEIGYNFKFTDLQAALGIVQMKKLAWRLKRKKAMYQLYYEELKGVKEIKFIQTDLSQTSPWFIDIIVSDPMALQKYLQAKKIGTRLFYPAIHTTKPYWGSAKFPNSLWASRHGLWLPSSTFLSDNDIKRVCRAIKSFYEKNKDGY